MIAPLGVLVATVGVDVHKNRLELLWNGYGRREESWGLDHVVLPGEVEDDSVWTDLWRELTRQFDHALGCKIGLTFGFVDGGKWPDRVYRFLRRLAGTAAYPGDPLPGSPVRGKIRACRGYGGPTPKGGRHPLVKMKYSPGLAGNLGGHWIGTDAAKDLIYTRARLEPPADGESFPEGYMHFPMSFSEEFVRQMFSERVTVKYERGQEIRTYDKKQSVRNEALDLEVYCLAAFKLLRLNNARFDAIEAELKEKALLEKMPQKKLPPKPKGPQRRKRERSAWLKW
jgi:phage terminase large subunit GpA-like protein